MGKTNKRPKTWKTRGMVGNSAPLNTIYKEVRGMDLNGSLGGEPDIRREPLTDGPVPNLKANKDLMR